MKIRNSRWLAVAGMIAMLAAPAGAQQPGGVQGGQRGGQLGGQQGGQLGGQQGGQRAAGANAGAQGQMANVPQYWVAGVSIYTGSALTTAHMMTREARFNVQAPGILGSQARFLVGAIDRALRDLEALQRNSIETNPTAIPPIRYTVAQLQAARTQATRVAQAAAQGQLGPTYQVTIKSAQGHLISAGQALPAIGRVYGVEQIARLPLLASLTGGQQGGRQFGGQAAFGGNQSHTAGYRQPFNAQGQQQGQQGRNQQLGGQSQSQNASQGQSGQGQQSANQGQQTGNQSQQAGNQGQQTGNQGQQTSNQGQPTGEQGQQSGGQGDQQ